MLIHSATVVPMDPDFGDLSGGDVRPLPAHVPDDLYRDFVSVYGETRAVVLLALIGQYLATCTVTTCFRVPAPGT